MQLNRRGIGLVGVLVTSAVVCAVAVGMGQMLIQSSKTSQKLKAQDHLAAVAAQVEAILRSPPALAAIRAANSSGAKNLATCLLTPNDTNCAETPEPLVLVGSQAEIWSRPSLPVFVASAPCASTVTAASAACPITIRFEYQWTAGSREVELIALIEHAYRDPKNPVLIPARAVRVTTAFSQFAGTGLVCEAGQAPTGTDASGNAVCMPLALPGGSCPTGCVLRGFDASGSPICKKQTATRTEQKPAAKSLSTSCCDAAQGYRIYGATVTTANAPYMTIQGDCCVMNPTTKKCAAKCAKIAITEADCAPAP